MARPSSMLAETRSATSSARRPAAASTSTGAPSRIEAVKAACSAAIRSRSSQRTSSTRPRLELGHGDARGRG
jgi:hypothetical protein